MGHTKSKKRRSFKNILSSKPVYISLVVVALSLVVGIIVLFYSLANQSRQTTATQASEQSTNISTLIDKYYSRIPEEQELMHKTTYHDSLSLSEQEKEKAHRSVYYVAHYPSLSSNHADWADPETGKTIKGRSWQGIYDIFPPSDYDEIIYSGMSKEQAQQVINERKNAIRLFMDKYFGYMLNDLVSTKYRIEIVNFPEQYSLAKDYDERFNKTFGMTTNLLSQNPNVVAAEVLAEKGYTHIDILIDRNIYGSTQKTNVDNEYISLFQSLTDEGVIQMADAINEVHTMLSLSNPNTTYRYLYMNEIDLINCHYNNNCDENPDNYAQYSVSHPEKYAESYYKLASELADRRITLLPSTIGFGWAGTNFYTGENGMNPWLEALAKYQNIKYSVQPDKQGYVQNFVATNMYGTVEFIDQRMEIIRDNINLVNNAYGSKLSIERIQEFGILPHQPNRDSYYDNIPSRIDQLTRIIQFFDQYDAAIYAQTAKNLAPWDGDIPDTLLNGNSNFAEGFVYRDEPELWPTVKDSLNGLVTGSQVPSQEIEEDISTQSSDTENPETESSPSETDTPNKAPDFSCPQEALNAGVADTCGDGVTWRGCYCDTSIGFYVNSCGEAGSEEYKPTEISCGSNAPQPNTDTPSEDDQPAEQSLESAESCTKNAPNDAIANEGQFGEAMEFHCFPLYNGQHVTCSPEGPSREGVACDWCFGGFCLKKE